MSEGALGIRWWMFPLVVPLVIVLTGVILWMMLDSTLRKEGV